MKKETDNKETDIVFDLLQAMLANSPEASYKRLNPALRSTLSYCIEADLPFKRDTFQRVCNELRGGRWFGDGAGSSLGEHFYTEACDCNHASALQSFEQFAERPGVLWEENVTAPARLHVGSRFTWRGYYVTVTSMRTDSLVACTYRAARNSIEGLKMGAEVGRYNEPHVITSVKKAAGAVLLRVVKAEKASGEAMVARRFTIKYDELVVFRREESQRVKVILGMIASMDPRDPKERKLLEKAVSKEQFRHFQLEKINAAARARRVELETAEAEEKRGKERLKAERQRAKWLAEKPRHIERWRAGANGAYLAVEEILLRVRGDLVECSNGNSASVAAVKRALPVILDRRGETAEISLPLDGHTIKRIGPEGVKVVCTMVPWGEIDLVAKQLAESTAENAENTKNENQAAHHQPLT